tara:strand:- start:387 stop:806 length:420 start_codon:yes stop_codon:yes gene_type:complete
MVKLVHEVISEARQAKSNPEKVKILHRNNTAALRDILRGTYDKLVVWNVPKGEPPHQPSDGYNDASNLLRQNRQFKYFVSGLEGDKLPKAKREMLFIKLLESIHPSDAKLVIQMTNKKAITGVPKSVVQEAFPKLLVKP